MSTEQQNIEHLREMYKRWNEAGNVPYDMLHSEIEWHSPLGTHRVARGVDELKALREDLFEEFEQIATQPERFVAAGDRVAVLARITIQRHDRLVGLTESPSAQMWWFRDGLPARFEVLESHEAALTELGPPVLDVGADDQAAPS